jgi:hypothetical protein
MRRISKGLLIAGIAVAFVAPASADAASLVQIYKDYSAHGTIDPCKYSAGDLQSAVGSIPTDVQQYDPRFIGALNHALEYRAAGGCKHAPSPSQVSGAGTTASGGAAGGAGGGGGGLAKDGSPKPLQAPATVSAAPVSAVTPPDLNADRGFPLALGILAAIVAVILAAAGISVLARRYGWDFPGLTNPFSRARAKLTR